MLTVRHWLPALGLIGPLVGCAERPEEVEAATSSAGSPRVALLTIDTWRADHFSAEHTPNLWALAEQGQRFTNAWSPIGLTSPAHATMFTGVPPWEHGMEANNHHGYRLPADAQTVAEDYPDECARARRPGVSTVRRPRPALPRLPSAGIS